MSTQLDLISVGRISLDFYANESNVGFKDVKTFSMSIGGSPLSAALVTILGQNKHLKLCKPNTSTLLLVTV